METQTKLNFLAIIFFFVALAASFVAGGPVGVGVFVVVALLIVPNTSGNANQNK